MSESKANSNFSQDIGNKSIGGYGANIRLSYTNVRLSANNPVGSFAFIEPNHINGNKKNLSVGEDLRSSYQPSIPTKSSIQDFTTNPINCNQNNAYVSQHTNTTSNSLQFKDLSNKKMTSIDLTPTKGSYFSAKKKVLQPIIEGSPVHKTSLKCKKSEIVKKINDFIGEDLQFLSKKKYDEALFGNKDLGQNSQEDFKLKKKLTRASNHSNLDWSKTYQIEQENSKFDKRRDSSVRSQSSERRTRPSQKIDRGNSSDNARQSQREIYNNHWPMSEKKHRKNMNDSEQMLNDMSKMFADKDILKQAQEILKSSKSYLEIEIFLELIDKFEIDINTRFDGLYSESKNMWCEKDLRITNDLLSHIKSGQVDRLAKRTSMFAPPSCNGTYRDSNLQRASDMIHRTRKSIAMSSNSTETNRKSLFAKNHPMLVEEEILYKAEQIINNKLGDLDFWPNKDALGQLSQRSSSKKEKSRPSEIRISKYPGSEKLSKFGVSPDKIVVDKLSPTRRINYKKPRTQPTYKEEPHMEKTHGRIETVATKGQKENEQSNDKKVDMEIRLFPVSEVNGPYTEFNDNILIEEIKEEPEEMCTMNDLQTEIKQEAEWYAAKQEQKIKDKLYRMIDSSDADDYGIHKNFIDTQQSQPVQNPSTGNTEELSYRLHVNGKTTPNRLTTFGGTNSSAQKDICEK